MTTPPTAHGDTGRLGARVGDKCNHPTPGNSDWLRWRPKQGPSARMSNLGGVEPRLIDVRAHQVQLALVGAVTIAFVALAQPWAVAVFAFVTMPPLIPRLYLRFIQGRLSPVSAVEDTRLPAFARIAGGLGLAGVAVVTAVWPTWPLYAALCGLGLLCLYGAVTGYCVPCSVLTSLERHGVVTFDPPLVCSVRLRPT